MHWLLGFNIISSVVHFKETSITVVHVWCNLDRLKECSCCLKLPLLLYADLTVTRDTQAHCIKCGFKTTMMWNRSKSSKKKLDQNIRLYTNRSFVYIDGIMFWNPSCCPKVLIFGANYFTKEISTWWNYAKSWRNLSLLFVNCLKC